MTLQTSGHDPKERGHHPMFNGFDYRESYRKRPHTLSELFHVEFPVRQAFEQSPDFLGVIHYPIFVRT